MTMQGIFTRFTNMLSPKVWKAHPAVFPMVVITGIGVAWGTTFSTYFGLMKKPDVNLGSRPRFLDVTGNLKMIDSRKFSQKPMPERHETDEVVKLRNEINAAYYPKA